MNWEVSEETPNVCIFRGSPGSTSVVGNVESQSNTLKSRLSPLDERIQKTETDIAFLTQEGEELRRRIEENDRRIKELREKVEHLLSLLN